MGLDQDSATGASTPRAATLTVLDPVPARAEAGTIWPPVSPTRQVAEFLALLLTGILFTRTFMAEAYIVPTGSMAPTLLGAHQAYTCPNCQHRFVLGLDAAGYVGRPVCPNCGDRQWDDQAGVAGHGDRLLVQKFLFDLRPPRRWEAVVFQNPADPAQAYVKRVVGLPGESVLIRDGDVYINDQIARKSEADWRALRILVYDHDHTPADLERVPRWYFRLGGGALARRDPSGWQIDGTALVRPSYQVFPGQVDWAEYRHWEPDREGYGPIRDFVPYNGLDVPSENRVHDLILEAQVAVTPDVEAIAVRISPGADRFLVTIPVDRSGPVEVRRNGHPVNIWETGATLHSAPADQPNLVHLEVALVDHRLSVLLDSHLLFEPFDYDDPVVGPGGDDRPVALGVRGTGRAELHELRLWRDIYYTDALAGAARPPFGIGEPYPLGPGEYFVLGDNSPVSNDSRFWPESPVVRRELFLGKPFLVHLPSQAVPLQVFGRELYWIPDPREIRYIH